MTRKMDWSKPPTNLTDLKALAEEVSSDRDLYYLGEPPLHASWPDGTDIYCGDYSYGVGYIPAQFVLNAFEHEPEDAVSDIANGLVTAKARAMGKAGKPGHGKYYTQGFIDALDLVADLIDEAKKGNSES